MPNHEQSPPATTPGLGARFRAIFGRSGSWVVGCVAAGLAVITTSAVTDAGKSALRTVRAEVCTLTSRKAPDADHFRVVVARLANDTAGEVQERIADQLVPTSFSVVRGCVEGPAALGPDGDAFDRRARAEATKQLAALSADVLIFGRVEGDKAALRFADRNGYCSNVTKVVPVADLNQEVARSALARALSDRIVQSLVSDCEGEKVNRLDARQLNVFAGKIRSITAHYGATAEPDVKFIVWSYRAWVEARLALIQGGEPAVHQALERIVADAPDNYAKAASLWGLDLFSSRAELPRLQERVRDDAYVATRTWDEAQPAWISMAMLAEGRIEADHAGDPEWKLRYYDQLTDRVVGDGPDYVPLSGGEVDRAYYRFAHAVLAAPHPTDRQVENAVTVLVSMLQTKIDGGSVPVTTNALRYTLARAYVLSAQRQKTPSRLQRAEELLAFIEAHPDDSTELTPKVLAEVRRDIHAECRRQHCTFASTG